MFMSGFDAQDLLQHFDPAAKARLVRRRGRRSNTRSKVSCDGIPCWSPGADCGAYARTSRLPASPGRGDDHARSDGNNVRKQVQPSVSVGILHLAEVPQHRYLLALTATRGWKTRPWILLGEPGRSSRIVEALTESTARRSVERRRCSCPPDAHQRLFAQPHRKPL